MTYRLCLELVDPLEVLCDPGLRLLQLLCCHVDLVTQTQQLLLQLTHTHTLLCLLRQRLLNLQEAEAQGKDSQNSLLLLLLLRALNAALSPFCCHLMCR